LARDKLQQQQQQHAAIVDWYEWWPSECGTHHSYDPVDWLLVHKHLDRSDFFLHMSTQSNKVWPFKYFSANLFVWLVADGWCWFVLREKYCWMVAGGWFVLREKYCWLVADKPSEHIYNTIEYQAYI
jgi:hypothetical protein